MNHIDIRRRRRASNCRTNRGNRCQGALADCPPVFTDAIEHRVVWKDGGDVSAWAGCPARCLVELCEADLYAIRFALEEGDTDQLERMS